MALFGRKKKGSSGGSSVLKGYEKSIREGFDYIEKGDKDKAKLTFRKVLRWVSEDIEKINKLPEDEKNKLSDLLTDAGIEMVKLGEYDVAIKLLERAKTINPKNFRAWMTIGKDLLQRNTQIPYALVCLREASRIDPENVEVHLLLGDAYRIQGQTDKALGAYQKALKVDPENPAVLEKVLRIQPENVEILDKYISVLERSGDKEELLKTYNKIVAITGNETYLERGLQIDPNNKDLLLNKAQILIKEDKINEAKEILFGLIKKYPDDPDIKMLYDELMPTEEKEEKEVKSIEVGDVFGDLNLGEAAPAMDDMFSEPEVKEEPQPEPEPPKEEKEEIPNPEDTMEVSDVQIEEPPKKEVTLKERFMDAYSNRKFDEASKLLDEMGEAVRELMGESTEIMKFVLSHLLMVGNYEIASEFMDKIAKVEPTEENKIELARILIESNKMNEAESVLNDIVKKNMKNGRALYLKARIQSVKGNDMGAKNFLRMALKFNPELKEEAKDDAYFEKYQDSDWFKSITS